MSAWLVDGLAGHGLTATLLETRHVRAALSARIAKTDRNDARGMAQLLRMGWFHQVHAKTVSAREQRLLLAARTTLTRRLRDLDNSVRGLLRGFGLRPARSLRRRWSSTVRELITGNPGLLEAIELILCVRDVLETQLATLDKRIRDIARDDPVCQRLMTVPGVGPIVAVTFRATIDRPERFRSSKSVGASLGLTPRRYQSGETDRSGGISRCGDGAARAALFEAAHVLLTRVAKWSTLKAWAMRVARRRGAKRAKVALARKLAVVLHRLWLDGTEFRYINAALEQTA
jgi:transposase